MGAVIYGLIDPRNNQLRYIGKTARPLEYRLSAHICRTNTAPKRHSSRWISGLLAEGMKPEIVTIEEVSGDWREAEQFWIAYFRFIGASLVNLTNGGEGVEGYIYPAERKQQMSAKFKGRVFDDEWKAKISAAKRGKPGKKMSPESKAKQATSYKETLSRRPPRTHCCHGHDLNGRKRCAVCAREDYLSRRPPLKTPEEISLIQREVSARPEVREARRVSMKIRMSDPVYAAYVRKPGVPRKGNYPRGARHPNWKGGAERRQEGLSQ